MWNLVDCSTGEILFQSWNQDECINVGLALRKILNDESLNLWVL